ncbi:MAG: HK97 family phage prohead protease [Caulobacteraceae bacterium]|nr:HK97 family phage prohead protease [Caulobacteraceae bacterium]
MSDLNESGRAYARSLIAAGKVDRTSSWSFSAEDGDALLGAGGADWTTYAKAHLGIDRSATDKTKARWNYPFAKGGKVYRSALIAIKQRAGAQGESAILAAATELLDKVDAGQPAKSAAGALETKFAAFEFKFVEDGSKPPGTFEGYASTFNTEDDGGDMMLTGAFDRTLAQAKATGRMPKMLLNHGGMAGYFSSPAPMDLVPIGKWSALTPDSHGLQAEGRLINLDTENGKQIHGAMKEGELADLSIGYVAKDFTRGTKPNEPRRQLKAVDLHEISPVTFPMNRLANINTVKGLGLSPFDMRDLEAALRDGGLSRGDAVKAVAVFKTLLQRDAGDPDTELRDAATSDDVSALVARIRAAAA